MFYNLHYFFHILMIMVANWEFNNQPRTTKSVLSKTYNFKMQTLTIKSRLTVMIQNARLPNAESGEYLSKQTSKHIFKIFPSQIFQKCSWDSLKNFSSFFVFLTSYPGLWLKLLAAVAAATSAVGLDRIFYWTLKNSWPQ